MGFMSKRQGGTEIAPMSATTDINVAAKFCVRGGQNTTSVLLSLKVTNFLNRGVELDWLSVYPQEAEVCYPPLTYLRPTGKRETIQFVGQEGQYKIQVIEVEPSIP